MTTQSSSISPERKKLIIERLKKHSSKELENRLKANSATGNFNNDFERSEAVKILRGRKQDIAKWEKFILEDDPAGESVPVEDKKTASKKTAPGEKKERAPRTILTPEQEKDILRLHKEGKSIYSIRVELGLNWGVVNTFLSKQEEKK